MAAGSRRVSRRGCRGAALLSSRPLRRAVCYRAPEQQPGTVGLLVLSNNRANRTTREVTACPVYETARPGPGVLLPAGWVSVGYLLPRAEASLADEAFTADPAEMQQVDAALADLLLIPELCSATPYARPTGPDGAYPRWATTYYAEPPLGGQNKRWFVVSHDHFNAATGDAVCVRTTSNTDYSGPETPLIEGGTAVAVCPDVQTKTHRRFFLDSADDLPQVRADERRRVALGLANYLGLQHFVTGAPAR